MFEYILSNWDTLIYVLVFVIIYIALILLWRKLATIETSVYRLDKILATICAKHIKPDEDVKEADKAFQEVFVTACSLAPMPQKESNESRPEKIVEIPEELNNEFSEVNSVDVKDHDDDTDSKASISKTRLQKMNIETLREQARNLGIAVDGTKAELISRIMESQSK